jgi:hypothetical protein
VFDSGGCGDAMLLAHDYLLDLTVGARGPAAVAAGYRVLAFDQRDVDRSLPLLRAMCFEDYYARLHEISIETTVLCGAWATC